MPIVRRSVVAELQHAGPVYYLLMKVAALFGIGGPLFGLAVAKRLKRR